MNLALRIDVDTYDGSLIGVKNLLSMLNKYEIKAAFFFSLGPDNMGKNIFRLFKPAFFNKVLRTNATSIYNPKTIIKGLLSKGPIIYKDSKNNIKEAENSGHEIGLHAWDHQLWQANAEKWTEEESLIQLKKAYYILSDIIERPTDASAAPGWKITDNILKSKENLNFKYNSDCRGEGAFYPIIEGKSLSTPQIPQNLPTFDEVIGTNSINKSNYNEFLLSLIENGKQNLLTIHSEIEGMHCIDLFENFLKMAKEKNINFVLPSYYLNEKIKTSEIETGKVSGREGFIGLKKEKELRSTDCNRNT